MALPVLNEFSTQGNRYKLFTFVNAGDELPIHRHTYDHITIVCHGEATAFDYDREVPLKQGESLMFEAGKDHGVRATVPGTVILNVQNTLVP